MASPDKINPYNLADLKNTSDDTIPNYLNSLKFRQSSYLVDVRLALGYSSIVIAAACGLWDYKFGFESTKLYTAVAVAVYTILDCALIFWLSEVEKGTVYQGYAPSGEQITIASSTKKNDPTYRLAISVKSPGGETSTFNIAKPFAEWFDETGRFVAPPFQQMLATHVPVIGKSDPRRVKLGVEQILHDNPELLDKVALAAKEQEQNNSVSTAASVKEKKADKRRKA
ncbi:hypothetical protein CDD82_1049 [Ophiocordyceps australis]|uniref:Signal peptidase complex subunit 2 n=1 Tax=Ophiocordyceps australis TaxID=1399860 RepID=A0A2C5ZH65_9HYPO|nr:hypothetical protein CDD82_1049 [Ophiocordyceps australis]